jgi:hypothetical protein
VKEVSPASEVRIRLQANLVKNTEILWTGIIPQEKELLRRIQEPNYRTENTASLVYVV